MWVSCRALFRILGGALAGWHLLFLWWVVQSVPGAPLLRRWWGAGLAVHRWGRCGAPLGGEGAPRARRDAPSS